jgi:hypothetical protein
MVQVTTLKKSLSYFAMSIYDPYLTFPFIFFIDGNANLFRWNTNILGSLLSSVLILAFEFYVHFSHLYWSFESSESSLRKLAMHLSIEVSNAKLRVMKGLNVTDLLLHLPQVTIVFYIPTKNIKSLKYFTTEKFVYDRRVREVVFLQNLIWSFTFVTTIKLTIFKWCFLILKTSK